MDPSTQDDAPLSSPESTTTSSTRFSIPPSNYLTVPCTRPSGSNLILPAPTAFEEDDTDLLFASPTSASGFIPQILEPSNGSTPTRVLPPSSFGIERSGSPIGQSLMSVYSTSSIDSEHSNYSNPPARNYRLPSFQNMPSSRRINAAEKDQMIQALNSHQVNTLVELRRIEKAFAVLGSPDVAAPMTAAWSYYVNSNSLLTELRGLTKNYPFSSECLEEAKRRVYSDPNSNRSWNFCWLVLSKVRTDQLIPYYAQYQASQPTMWGGRTPTSEGVSQLTSAFIAEWNWAIDQMLRHWDQPPTR